MKSGLATAEAELRHGEKKKSLKALVDTGASKSVISRRLADELGAFIPLSEPYELRTADENRRL